MRTAGDALLRRLSAAGGLLLAAAVAVWWLGSTRVGLLGGADTARPAAQALLALALLRGLVLAAVALRDGARRGIRPAATAALLWLAPAWPVVMLAWSASTVALGAVLATEAALFAAACLLPAGGAALARALRPADRAEAVALALGVLMAAALWWGRAPLAAALG